MSRGNHSSGRRVSDLRSPSIVEPEIPADIKAQTTERLLTLFAQLTHKIHAAQAVQAGLSEGSVDVARRGEAELRAQRDIVKREVIWRCDRV